MRLRCSLLFLCLCAAGWGFSGSPLCAAILEQSEADRTDIGSTPWMARSWFASLPDAPSENPSAATADFDPFRQAVRIAGQAAIAGQTTQSYEQWLELALQWHKAADLMAIVPPDDPRYSTAQNRVIFYRQNYQQAQQQAHRLSFISSSASPSPHIQQPGTSGTAVPNQSDSIATTSTTAVHPRQTQPWWWIGLGAVAAIGAMSVALFYGRKRPDRLPTQLSTHLTDRTRKTKLNDEAPIDDTDPIDWDALKAQNSMVSNVDTIPVSSPVTENTHRSRPNSFPPTPPKRAQTTVTRMPAELLTVGQTTRLAKIDIVSQLIDDLENFDVMKRRKAIWELSRQGDSRAIQPLIELLMESDSRQRSLVLGALAEIGSRTLKPMSRALLVALQDDNAEVRKNAIRDLTRIYDCVAQISYLLRHAIDDPDAEVQETAQWALGHLSRIRTTIGIARFPAPPRSERLPRNPSQISRPG